MSLALGLLAIAAMGASGSLVSAHNGAIGARLGPWRATRLFMVVGSVCALVFVLVFERGSFDAASLASLPPYVLVPGLLNGLVVAAVIRLVRVLGTVQTTATVFTGSVTVGLLLDHAGAFDLPTIAVSGLRLAGAACLVAGVVLMASRSGTRTLHDPASGLRSSRLVLAALSCGALDAVGVAMNTTLAVSAGPFSATVAFLLPGALLMTIVLLARPTGDAPLRASDLVPGVWNVVALAVALSVIPSVGLHLANGARFAAAVAAGNAVDHLGAFGGARIPIDARRLVASTLLVAGVLVSIP